MIKNDTKENECGKRETGEENDFSTFEVKDSDKVNGLQILLTKKES